MSIHVNVYLHKTCGSLIIRWLLGTEGLKGNNSLYSTDVGRRRQKTERREGTEV